MEDHESLQKCGRCKVLQYCSRECQTEHWELVHKAHCRKLARAKQVEGVGRGPVGVFSQHPFPDLDAESGSAETYMAETTEVLVDIVQKLLVRLKFRNSPLFHSVDQLLQLENIMEMNRMKIWGHRKLYPERYREADIDDGCSTHNDNLYFKLLQLQLTNEASQDIWRTLLLVWGRLIDHRVEVKMSRLKDPRQAMPLDAWKDFIEDDAGLFPARLNALISAFHSNQFISYKELLKAFCGGSLEQHCSFCDATMTVEAVHRDREIKGDGKGAPAVNLMPHLTLMYCCAAPTCEGEMAPKKKAWMRWREAVTLTHNKLFKNRCNFCFKLAEGLHRQVLKVESNLPYM